MIRSCPCCNAEESSDATFCKECGTLLKTDSGIDNTSKGQAATVTMSKMNEHTNSHSIGFLSLYELPNPTEYIASVLITDHVGIPLEFKLTQSISPNNIQRALYGAVLEPYVGVQLCGIPLLRSIQVPPALVVVDKEYLLEVRIDSNTPLVFVQPIGQQIHVTSSTEGGRGVQPIDIRPHARYPNDKTYAQQLIQSPFNRLDLIEPFSRMARAVEAFRERRGIQISAGSS